MKRQTLSGVKIALILLVVLLLFPCRGAAQEEVASSMVYERLALEAEKKIVESQEKILAGVAAIEGLLRSSKTDAAQMTGKWNEIKEQYFYPPALKDLYGICPMLKLSIDTDERVESNLRQRKPGDSGSGGQGHVMPDGRRILPPTSPSVDAEKKPEQKQSSAAVSGNARITRAVARDILKEAEDLTGFAREIQSVGEAVAWTLKVNRHIESLEFDIGTAPVRVEAYVKQMKEVSESLTFLYRKVKEASSGQHSYANLKIELAQAIDFARSMHIVTINAATSLVNTAKYLEPQAGYVIPETELKRMEVLADYWKDVRNLYPLLKREIADGTARWAPSPKAKWANYLESKKEFNKVYAPLLAGDLFKGIPYFEGKKYDELARIFPPIQRDLMAMRLMVENQKQKAETVKKLLEQDEDLTAREQEEIRNLEGLYGPEREKILIRAVHKAGGGYARVVELERFLENSERKDGPYDRAKEELDSLVKRRNPDQRTADSALETFYKGLVEAQKRVDTIVKEHTKRKKDLGLIPVLKESKLAKEKVFDTIKPRS